MTLLRLGDCEQKWRLGGAEEHNSLLFFTLAAAHLSVGWLLDWPYGGRYPFFAAPTLWLLTLGGRLDVKYSQFTLLYY